MLSLCNSEISYVSNYKISITLLLKSKKNVVGRNDFRALGCKDNANQMQNIVFWSKNKCGK